MDIKKINDDYNNNQNINKIWILCKYFLMIKGFDEKYKSIDINLIKNIIAFIIFIPAFINLSSTTELKNILILLISGIIGIGLGDTFYLKSLQTIGTRKTLSIETLSPLMAALSGEIFINENLTTKSWVGIIIVSISLFIILRKGNDFKEENSYFKSSSKYYNFI